jgi:dienelactone hydrolase
MTGAADAVMRGWDAVAFDGPGQGHALFVDGVGPTDDWAPVGRSVLDATIAAGGVDEERIASSGISDGGYLAAVHAAADPRVKALVCDPGVVRPVDGALAALPARLRAAWAGGDRELAPVAPDERFALAKLTEQWPGLGPAEVLERLSRRDLAECAHAIACPVFVADPDSAMSFPGQSAALAELLGDRATLVSFASRDGAGLDCEIGAPRLRNQKVFDWLDDVLDVASGRRKENS